MTTEIKDAIAVLVAKINPNVDCGEALKLTQAALNLAHTENIIMSMELHRQSLGNQSQQPA